MTSHLDRYMTLPVEEGQEDVVLDLFDSWHADALRDSDGTTMPEALFESGHDIYSVMCIVRADQEYAYAHPEYLHKKYLMSFPVTAFSNTVKIKPLAGYSKDKYELDDISDPYRYWEVRDRTANTVVSPNKWQVDISKGIVTINDTFAYHEYTVSFLARQIWDSVSMYNALTNGWEGSRVRSVDPYHPECRKHLVNYMQKWLEEHPNTTVVRFTTFAYLFVIDTGSENQDIYRDWTGYGETVSELALYDFEKEYGYRLTPEDFVDSGYYNGTYKIPSKRYRDWMEFVQKFVADFARELVDMCHKSGKRTAMFQGDHWIGTEPFLPSYEKIRIDINIGAVEDGVALRRLTDSGGTHVREARFYPYFFPDVFREGNNPVVESMKNWTKIRRAMLQKPLDRIGYGGYLSLATKFPKFISHVSTISNEFGSYLKKSAGTEPLKIPGKVAVLNAWGKSRSWLQNQDSLQRFYVPPRPDVMEFVGTNMLECLAGLPFDVEFISFDDIIEHGIGQDVKVIINSGDANSAWSGGAYWSDQRVLFAIRKFVAEGGGFLGIGCPSAFLQNGRYLQLGDVMGIEKEVALTMGRVAQPICFDKDHFLAQRVSGNEHFGEKSFVYMQNKDLSIICADGQHISFCCKEYKNGRSSYIAGLPFSSENAFLLRNVLMWLGKNETANLPYLSENPFIDLAYYPETKQLATVNFSADEQRTTFLYNRNKMEVSLKQYEWQWIEL